MILEKITSPEMIKKLSISELRALAEEVRKRIIEVTAKNGGHIAPSLGATDLAIALLHVFVPDQDRIVWDVGHQSYAYKILTGRNDRFDTLREYGGISGFNRISESKYDAFGVGHSSTSISAALGITMAKECLQEPGLAIAVIGDGALTGGMAFEALNHAGHLNKNLIVILNDNNMSISPNVGALQKYFADFLVSRSYNKLKGKIWDILQNLPASDHNKRRILHFAQKFEGNIVSTFAPNIIFEDMGFKYAGPIDGHNIAQLTRTFRRARDNMEGPVLLHVITRKGKGYVPAEANAAKFHGLGPFQVETGECLSKSEVTYSRVFGNKLTELARENERIVAITAAMTDGTGLSEFAKEFPDRFFDVGIAEQHAVTFAAGFATRKMKPVVAIYSTFMQRAYDQLIHDVALQKLPVVFCLDRAGLVGEDGATHHGSFDISYLGLIPDLVVMAPSSSDELEKMLSFACNYESGPVAIRYARGLAPLCNSREAEIILGKSVVVSEGEKVAVIGVGNYFFEAEKLVKMIRDKYQIEPVLIDPRFIKPLDTELLENLKSQVDIVITLEDNALKGGFGMNISNYYCNTDIKVYSFGLPDEFITHGKIAILKSHYGLEATHIFKELEEKDIF
ncbi:MAG: 1-deoxy-D-xylulose-5-phosphate synthase [Candidatus Stygibacter australis]|nr:1-deoxy-D-xylulose-5-phosphate synthase [Candidatus Stygibacter australis]MDP8321013.1 1-deoxy-D-xylulose-5-phosphate synthase [Candidatus Stygibacter australis]